MLSGRNLREECLDRDKPCETLQTGQRAGRSGRVDTSYFQTNSRTGTKLSRVPFWVPTPLDPSLPSLTHKRPNTQTGSGRLHLASPVSFACARARAGRRAAGMTQLRLSTLEPQIKSCGPTCHHHNQQEIFFFFSPALLASRPFPHAHAAPCPEQADRCDIADLVSGQSSRIRRPCVPLTSRGIGDCQTQAGMKSRTQQTRRAFQRLNQTLMTGT